MAVDFGRYFPAPPSGNRPEEKKREGQQVHIPFLEGGATNQKLTNMQKVGQLGAPGYRTPDKEFISYDQRYHYYK